MPPTRAIMELDPNPTVLTTVGQSSEVQTNRLLNAMDMAVLPIRATVTEHQDITGVSVGIKATMKQHIPPMMKLMAVGRRRPMRTRRPMAITQPTASSTDAMVMLMKISPPRLPVFNVNAKQMNDTTNLENVNEYFRKIIFRRQTRQEQIFDRKPPIYDMVSFSPNRGQASLINAQGVSKETVYLVT